MLISRNEQLISATIDGKDVATIDDGFGELFLYSDEFGPVYLIRSQTWHDAHEFAIDAMSIIKHDKNNPSTDVIEAYGFYVQEKAEGTFLAIDDRGEAREIIGELETIDLAISACLKMIADQECDLVEGCRYNSSGGIVFEGYYGSLLELCEESAKEHSIEVVVSRELAEQ